MNEDTPIIENNKQISEAINNFGYALLDIASTLNTNNFDWCSHVDKVIEGLIDLVEENDLEFRKMLDTALEETVKEIELGTATPLTGDILEHLKRLTEE